MKRLMLLTLLMPGALLAQAEGGLSNYRGQPKAEPFTETVFGQRIHDPYRWMERSERRKELKAWIDASSAHTRGELARLPGHADLLTAMREASKASDRFLAATVSGARIFYLKLGTGSQVPALWVREAGKDRLLVDPMAGGDGRSPRVLGGYSVSPSGQLVAINLTENGSEIGTATIYDVVTGRAVGEKLGPVWGEAAAEWLDDRTLLYSRIRDAKLGEDRLQRQTIMLHRTGTANSADLPLLGTDVPTGFKIAEREVPIVSASPTSRYVMAIAGGAQASVRVGIATAASLRAGKPDWREIATLDDKITRETAGLVGENLYYVTTKREAGGEVRRLALTPTATLAGSEQVLAGRGVISASLYTLDGAYAFVATPFAASRLWYAPLKGAAREIPLPFIGSAFLFATSADRRTGTFALDGFQQSTSNFQVDHGRLTSLRLDAATLPAARQLKIAEVWATSADGTKVPLTIVSGSDRTGPRPTIIEAYGSYGISTEPQYSPSFTLWSARGGVFAQCHTRGGGELGSAWHEGGSGRNKPNAQDDLIACGRRLVELGYATPKTLGLFGSSAAGLLVPMAAMKAPDLFAAAVTRVGVVNPTRLAAANNGANQFEEMGDPGTEQGFKALLAQDSVQFLSRAKGGPDFLFTIGLNDSRVEPWMSAKLVASMRARWGDRHLALIRADDRAGHGLNSTRDQAVEERTDIFAFFLDRFGALQTGGR